MQNHKDIMMALVANNGSVKLSGDEVQSQMKAEQDKFISSLLPYAATDKQDLFKADMAPR